MFDPEDLSNLEVPLLALDDPDEIAMATVIAEETERQRELLRQLCPDVGYELQEEPHPDLIGVLRYADRVYWSTLLTLGDCAFRCAQRTHSSPEAVLHFAQRRCRPPEPFVLFWCAKAIGLARNAGGDQQAKIEAAADDAVREKLREVAQRGGRRSGEERRKTARIPDDATLLKHRRELLATGTEERNIASTLGRRYNATPDAVRKRMNVAQGRERSGSGRE